MPTRVCPVVDEDGNIVHWEPPMGNVEGRWEEPKGNNDEAGQEHIAAVANHVLNNPASPYQFNPYMKAPTATKDHDNEDYIEKEEEHLDDTIMEELSEMEGWLADKTLAGYKSAVGAYNAFAKRNKYPLFHELTFKHLNGQVKGVPGFDKMAPRLCIHLMNYKINTPGKRFGKHLKPGSQAQYFSGIKTVLSTKFPKLPYFQNLSRYNDLYKRLKIRSRVAAIKRGESPQDKTEGIHRPLLEEINKELIRQNRFSDRAVINSLYASIG